MSWDQAKARCEAEGAKLASIVSWDIQKWITSEYGSQYNVWIGGSDTETEGTLKWVRGEAWEYANWDSCPNSNNADNKDCVKIKQGGSGRWNFARCDQTEKRFLCQRQSPTSKGLWTRIHSAEYAYMENSGCIRNWDDAVTRCAELGGGAKVASVLSPEVKNEYLATFATAFDENRHWIGLNDKGTEGTWAWTKGETYAWQNWKSDEPDNNSDKNCVSAGKSSGRGGGRDCDESGINAVLCMKGTSSSVGQAPAPAPSPAGSGTETKDKKYSYSYCGIAWYENQAQYSRSVCCQECQDDTHNPYTLDKISYKAGDCFCIDTTRTNCGSDEFEDAAGWMSADCTQGRRRRRRDLEEEQLDSGGVSLTTLTVPASREKRSVDDLTQREITCTGLDQTKQNLYWNHQYKIPSSCWSK